MAAASRALDGRLHFHRGFRVAVSGGVQKPLHKLVAVRLLQREQPCSQTGCLGNAVGRERLPLRMRRRALLLLSRSSRMRAHDFDPFLSRYAVLRLFSTSSTAITRTIRRISQTQYFCPPPGGVVAP